MGNGVNAMCQPTHYGDPAFCQLFRKLLGHLAPIGRYFACADDSQGKGVGSLLAQAVASLAMRRGATHLKATMAADNHAMLKLMERLGDTVVSHEGETVVAYTRLHAERVRSAA